MARSLPDVRDGLKPVHRRILHAMRELRLDPRSGYKKCARVVGDVIGKFHPHGDTASRLTRVAEALLEGIDRDAVDFRPTYDGEGEEPVVLPARFPNLLANGAAGIAVGMATSIPPHNLGELI